VKNVVDTNIVVSGLLWGGPAFKVLSRIEEGTDLLFTSRDLLLELHRVLVYPKIDRELKRVGLPRENVIAWVIEHATLILSA